MATDRSVLLLELKPFILRWITETVAGSGQGGAPSPHALNSAHHTGTLDNSQAPQFLLIDGSRDLAGNLDVLPGVTVDGVDLSVLATASFLTLGTSAQLTSERVLTQGAGITLTDGGAGSTLTVALTTPGTLTVATTNVSTGSHTHAITSSSNPGAAASLLATDGNGSLILDSGVLNVSATNNAVWINSGTPDGTAALRVTAPATDDRSLVISKLSSQTADLLQIEDELGADYVLVTSDGNLESGNPGFTSGLTGWQLSPAGVLEANHVIVRGEFRASIFTIGEMHATGGTMLIRPAGVLHAEVETV